MRKSKSLLFILFFTTFIGWIAKNDKPVVYLIGDSTVDDGSGNNGLWGWGKFLPQFFDTTRITIKNYAQGGTSARTFQTNGIWDKSINKRGMWDTVRSKMKNGDYLVIQFGLNDQGRIDDTARARGTLKGTGSDSVLIYNVVTKSPEAVHTFGWYLRRYIRQAKAKGATVIVCSSVPHNSWKDGRFVRGESGFADWALQIAKEENAFAIDLNNAIADAYEKEGEKAVTEKYHFGKDNVHTLKEGSILNASLVTKGIDDLKNCDLRKYLQK